MAPGRLPQSPVFWKIVKLEKALMQLPAKNVTLSNATLKSMNIERAPQLDIDNPGAADAYPVYFEALPESADLRRVVLGHENEVRCWSHCPHERQHVDRVSCALHTISWLEDHRLGVVNIAKLYPADEIQWVRGCYGPKRKFCSYSASTEHLKKHGERSCGFQPEWFTPQACVVDDNMARHAACYVADNTSHKTNPGEALRSEIAVAVSFIRRQMQGYDDVKSTIPVIIYSVYHNETVRITQMCWTGEHNPITFRQSRLLNIASDSIDTPDILLLLRWMACVPLRKPKVSRRPTTTGTQAAAPLLKPGPAPSAGARGSSTAAPSPPHASRPNTSANRPATPEQRRPGPAPGYTGSGSPLRQTSTPGKPSTGSIPSPFRPPVTGTTMTTPPRQSDTGNHHAGRPSTPGSRNTADVTGNNTATVGGTTPRQASTPMRNGAAGPPPGGFTGPNLVTNLAARSANGPQGQQADRPGSHR